MVILSRSIVSWDNFESTWDNSDQFETIWDNLRQLETTWDKDGLCQLEDGLGDSKMVSAETMRRSK